jgi:hypothetical protein
MAEGALDGCTAAACIIVTGRPVNVDRDIAQLLQRIRARMVERGTPEELAAFDRILGDEGQRIRLSVEDVRAHAEPEPDGAIGNELEDEGDVILPLLRQTVEPGGTLELRAMADAPFRPESLFIPLALAPDIVIESIRIGMRVQCAIGAAGIPASLFSYTCGHAECEGTARDSDGKIIDPEHAHALMIACMQKHKDARSRFLRRLHFDDVRPGLYVSIMVRNVARTPLDIEAALVGPRIPGLPMPIRMAPLGFGPTTVEPQSTVIVTAMPQMAVVPRRLVIPEQCAPHFMIESLISLMIGTQEQFATPGEPGVPADAFGAFAALGGNPLALERVMPGQRVAITARNITNEPRVFMASLICETEPSPAETALAAGRAVADGLVEGLERPNVALAEAIRRSHVRNGVIPSREELERTLIGTAPAEDPRFTGDTFDGMYDDLPDSRAGEDD